MTAADLGMCRYLKGIRDDVTFHIRTPPITPAPISLMLVTAHKCSSMSAHVVYRADQQIRSHCSDWHLETREENWMVAWAD